MEDQYTSCDSCAHEPHRPGLTCYIFAREETVRRGVDPGAVAAQSIQELINQGECQRSKSSRSASSFHHRVEQGELRLICYLESVGSKQPSARMRKAKGVTQASPKGISEEGPRARTIQAPIAEEATTVAHGVQEVKEKSERCRATSSPGTRTQAKKDSC